MSKRLTGLNPLAYIGVEPVQPSNMFMRSIAPTPTDSRNVNIGDFWVDTTTQQLWVLVSLAGGSATWITLFGGASDVFVTDSGTATPAAGIIHINGDGLNISTSAPGPSNIVDITLNPNLTLTGLTLTGFTGGVLVSNNSGVIGEVTTTNHSLLAGNATGTISSLGVATNGQLPIGSTGADPVLATITAGSGISVTNGAGTITIAATGGTGTVTSITAGTGITLTPSPITTTGSVALTVPVIVANGGTGDTSFTAYSVICGGTSSTGALQSVSGVGTAGQFLISNGAGALPTWQSGGSNVPQSVSLHLTNSQIKNLRATPIQILAAQGANTLIVPIELVSFLNYGGSNAFVAPTGIGISLYSTNVNAGNTILFSVLPGSSFTQTTSNYTISNSSFGIGITTASSVNQSLFVAIDQTASGEITGNAANDNTISIRLEYFVLTVPL